MVDKKIAWSLVVVCVLAALIWLIVWMINSQPNTFINTNLNTSLAPAQVPDIEEQEQTYFGALKDKLENLAPVINEQLTSASLSVITPIRQALVDMRVPVTQQDMHLKLVLKLAFLEDLLVEQNPSQSEMASLESTRKDILALVNKIQQDVN